MHIIVGVQSKNSGYVAGKNFTKRKEEFNWLNKKISYFKKLDKKYSKNLVRKNTSFPVSFSILAQK